MNAEFQRRARRDKKAFLSDQCKEIQENNRMGKINNLIKKIRDTKGTFHAKMGSIKSREPSPGILHIECSTFTASSFRIWNSSTGILSLPGASVRNSARGKGHEEGGLAYAKAGSSLRSPPRNSRASTPQIRVCLLYCFVLSPTPLTLQGAVPHYLSLKKELAYSSS